MAYSYPHTTTFDENEKSLSFEDGFEVFVPAGAVPEAVEVTIDKRDVEETEAGEPLSAAYLFNTESDPPELQKEFDLVVPTFVEVTVETALAAGDREPGEEMPSPTSWTPRPGGPPHDDGGKVTATHDSFEPVYITEAEE